MTQARRVVSAIRSIATAGVLVAGVLAAPSAGSATAATANPPALWYKTDGSPTDAQIAYAATHYSVVVLNAWETRAMRAIKAANPTITVLAYKCLSSTRSYSGAVDSGRDAAILPSGVGYIEAQSQHPEWFALSTSGQRVQWGPYPGHWQMAVWDPAYQARWAQNVTAEIVANGWDGVMADNALTTLKWYSSATLAGAPTDALLQAGERGLIATAAASLHAAGKLLVPNIGESRLYPGLWADWTGLADGGMEESYVHMDDDPASGFLWDWGSSGWRAQQANAATPGLFLAVTRWVPGDTRSMRYGLASFLAATGGRGAWQAGTDYDSTPWQAEQGWVMGSPVTAMTKVGGAYTRQFTSGFVAVNPSQTSQTVAVPSGMADASGATPSSVTLAPMTGAIYRTVATSTPAKKAWKHHTGVAPLPGTAPASGAGATSVTGAGTGATSGARGGPVVASGAASAPRTAAARPAAPPGPRHAADVAAPAPATPGPATLRTAAGPAAPAPVRATGRTPAPLPSSTAGEWLLLLPLLAAVRIARRARG